MIRKFALHKAINRVAECEASLQGTDLDRLVDFMQYGRTGSFLNFPGYVQILKDRRRLIITTGAIKTVYYSLIPGDDREIPEINFRTIWESSPFPPYRLGNDFTADLSLGDSGEITLSNALQGDHFHPLGAPGGKRLFRFLTDRKVSRWDKHRTLVLVQGDKIIWVVGHRISENARAGKPGGTTWRLSLMPMVTTGESS